MVVRVPLVLPALLLSFAVLAGCVDEGAGSASPGDAPASIPAGAPPRGEDAGSAAQHGTPQRTESEVTVSRNGDTWTARKTVTITNDFGGASAADVTASTQVGGVALADGGDGGYRMVASLSSSGSSEEQARARLGQMRVVHSDRVSSGRLVLSTDIPSGPGGGGISYTLPDEPAYRVTMRTDTGGLTLRGLGGPTLSMTTDTGGIIASGAFNTATFVAETGGISLAGTFNVLRATTSTGGIEAAVESTASGSQTYQVDTGGVEVRLAGGSGVGYDVTGDSDVGGVTLDLEDASPVGTQSSTHKHVRTDGYDGRAVRVTLQASADVGGVTVRD